MLKEITIEVDGQTYVVSYTTELDGEHERLTMYLPNGETRETILSGGLKLESAMKPHIRSFMKMQHKKGQGA